MKYDFARCNNLQFKAKVQGIERKGYLKVSSEGKVNMFYSDGEKIFDPVVQTEVTVSSIRFLDIVDFSHWAERHELEIIPRDPETYKDWKVGDCIIGKFNNDQFVIKAILNDIIIVNSIIVVTTGLFPSKFIGENYELILTDYEQELLKAQGKKECPFRKGDRVLVRNDDRADWFFEFFNSFEEGKDYPYYCSSNAYRYCIPYNEKTWKLLRTTDEYKEE